VIRPSGAIDGDKTVFPSLQTYRFVTASGDGRRPGVKIDHGGFMQAKMCPQRRGAARNTCVLPGCRTDARAQPEVKLAPVNCWNRAGVVEVLLAVVSAALWWNKQPVAVARQTPPARRINGARTARSYAAWGRVG
jgi:hypothetical protein